MKNIAVALLCNIEINENSSKVIKSLEEFVPNPPSCGLTTKVFCVSELSASLLDELTAFNPDLVINYGLGLGTFWIEPNKTIQINNIDIPLVLDNHDVQELFYSEKYLYTTLFDIIKKQIESIDLVKSRPSKLYTAKTEDDLKYLLHKCHTEPFGFDTETNFLNPFIKDPEPKLLCYSLAWLTDDQEGWCIPTTQPLMDSGNCTYTKDTVFKYTEDILFKSTQSSFIHNAAYDLLVLHELFDGKQPKNFTADTMILLYLYHHASKSAALKENTHLIGLPAYKDPIKDWIAAQPKQKGSKAQLGFEDVPLEIIAPYAAMDALAVTRLITFLQKHMIKSLWNFYYKVPHKVILCANELACEGYTISRDRFNYTKFSIEEYIKQSFSEMKESVKDLISDDINFNSSQQVGHLLYDKDKLNLPVFNKTQKGAPATDQKTLDDLMLFHPFIFKFCKFKKLQKLYVTYSYKGYSSVLNTGSRKYLRKNGWTINAQYKQINRTARLASSNFTGHTKSKKRGGNVLTLPAQGSMVKHYFAPNCVAEAENDLYQKIIDSLPEEERLKILEAEKYDISKEAKA